MRSIKCWSESKWVSFYSLIFRPLAQGCGNVAICLFVFLVCVGVFFSFLFLYSKLHCTFVNSGHPITNLIHEQVSVSCFSLGFWGSFLRFIYSSPCLSRHLRWFKTNDQGFLKERILHISNGKTALNSLIKITITNLEWNEIYSMAFN